MSAHRLLRGALAALAAVVVIAGVPLLSACATDDSRLSALLASPLRTEADLKADAGRHPLELLRFAQVEPGMKVLDLSAGGGYTTQLMALAVGPQGKVWAQVEKPSNSLAKRLTEHPQANIETLVRSAEDPYPTDAPRVDLVSFVLSYHDIANEPIDRVKMNRAIFAALKPGGHLVLIDHAAQEDSGVRDTKTLHRIDEKTVRSEVEAAGFVLEAEGTFLRNADDPREQAFFDMKMPADRFVLRFARPR